MLSLFRPLSGPDFARAAAYRNTAFAVFTTAFPFLLSSLVSASGCRGVGGACGALGLVLSMYIKPFVFFIFAFSFATIALRRLRDCSLPGTLAIGLVAIIFADVLWAMTVGAPWSVAFVTGGLGAAAPTSLMAGLALVVVLSVMGSRPNSEPEEAPAAGRRLSPATWLLLALVAVHAGLLLFTVIASMKYNFGAWLKFMMAARWIILPVKLLVALTPAILMAAAYRLWRAQGSPGKGSVWAYAACVLGVMIVGSSLLVGYQQLTALAAMMLSMRLASLPLPRQLLANLHLAGLLSLLVLPWLLSMLPGASSPSAAAPASPPPSGSDPRETRARRGTPSGLAPAGAVAFGRRGPR